MIQVEHLTKRYGSHTAVDDISFTVEDGCIYGLLGPNGAGKSTTMNILTGYLSATDGTVTIHGHDIAEEPAAAKACIGYLPEQPPLYQDMTVREYLLFVAELKGTRKKADRIAAVENACARTGLQEMAGRLIRNLSKGYRQRVGIAGALLNFVCADMNARGISTLYLVTDHTSFYERYGWQFYCMVQGDGEEEPSRLYIHTM